MTGTILEEPILTVRFNPNDKGGQEYELNCVRVESDGDYRIIATFDVESVDGWKVNF